MVPLKRGCPLEIWSFQGTQVTLMGIDRAFQKQKLFLTNAVLFRRGKSKELKVPKFLRLSHAKYLFGNLENVVFLAIFKKRRFFPISKNFMLSLVIF